MGIVICSLPFSVRGSRAAVLGYGRIGKSLAKKLVSLGADVTVFARKEAAKKEAEKICRAEDFSAFGGGFDYIMNTVPAKTVDPRLIGNCYVIELASAPFGFDDRCRETLGEMFVFAPGLPGKTAPRPAGYALADAVYDILKGDYFE